MTDRLRVRVGLHQGSALSPFLLAVVMNRLTDEIRPESPWTMMFADEVVIFSESRERAWRGGGMLWRGGGMNVSKSKTEYICV